MFRWLGISLFLMMLVGCRLDFEIPAGLMIACSEADPCSAGYICAREHGICVQQEPSCGNGILEFPEACDDGFQDACGTCNATCTASGTQSVCGDGVVCPELEVCDDGYEDSCGTCNSTCGGPGDGAACGDGEVCPEEEFCDDGFRTECGECNGDCSGPGVGSTCGDGILCEDTEACDDGNMDDEPCGYGNVTCTSCSSSCAVINQAGTYCGDGHVQEAFEVCDPAAETINCPNISNVFSSTGVAACQSDCSGWDTAICSPDTEDPEKMVWVSPGPFLRGCNALVDGDCNDDESPYRQIRLSGYFVDNYEVTVGQYRACVMAGGCDDTGVSVDPLFCNYVFEDRENHPMNCLDWEQANSYCTWAGKALPTEAQWEKAARGTDGRVYAWGNAPECSCEYVVMTEGGEGCGQNRTWPVGSKPAGVSPYDAHDMLGNVYEWTADWYDESYYARAPDSDPLGPTNENGDFLYRVLRGGSWSGLNPEFFRTSNRYTSSPANRFNGIGFRCVVSTAGGSN